MGFIIHRGGDRFVLQDADTGAFIGVMILPSPNESINMFAYNFGSTYDRNQLQNVADFADLDSVQFFAIEYPGFHDFDAYLRSPAWQPLHNLLRAEAKAISYNGSREHPAPDPVLPLWQHTPPNPQGLWKVPAWGLWVNDQGCWVSNRDGWVFALDHHGHLTHQHQLPKPVHCLAGDHHHLYASCNDGQIYTLLGKFPDAVYSARPQTISPYADCCLDGLVWQSDRWLILDAWGRLSSVMATQQVCWQRETATHRGWFLAADDRAIYHGHQQGVTCYEEQTGKTRWEVATSAPVLCGQLTHADIKIGTSDGTLYSLDPAGDVKTRQTDLRSLVTLEGAAIYALACTPDGQTVWLADHQANLYRWHHRQRTLHGPYPTGCGAVLALQLWGDRLYAVTTDGTIACFETTTLAAPSLTSDPSPPSPATQAQPRVLLECIQQGSKLKVRPVSAGYQTTWNVRFPSHLRQAGQRYAVEALQEATQGGFYRVVGKIEILD